MAKTALDLYIKKNAAIFKALRKEILAFDRICVFRHIKPDYDALGCQFGMVEFLKANFPEKEIHQVGDTHPVFVPRLFEAPEKLPNSWFDEDFLAIVLDVGDQARIADPRFLKAKKVIKLDHHPFNLPDVSHLSFVDEETASCGEIVTAFLKSFGKKVKWTKEAAKALYIAIVGDSGRFMYSSTSPLTFSAAAYLIDQGIDIRSIYLSMYEKTIDDLAFQKYVLNHYVVTEKGVAYYLLSDDGLKELGLTSERGKEHVNMFSNIEGIEAWCSITQDNDPKEPCWRISIRSKKKDISKVAQKWGGGGHPQASGAKIKDLTELDAFIADLNALF